MRWNAARPLALIGFGLAPAILLVGCDGDDDGARTTLANIEPSSYVTREPATTTTTIEGETPTDEEGRSTVEQEYEVQAGDYPLRIAQLYDIPLEELANYNEWTPPNYSEFPFPGTMVKIPPNALIPGAATPATADEDVVTGDATAPPTPTTLPTNEDGCTPGTYTITAEDTSRTRVAEQFDITVEQLDAANANTPGYSSFYPGLEIVIPC